MSVEERVKFNLSDDRSEIESLNSSFLSFLRDPKSFKTVKDFAYVLQYLKAHPRALRISVLLFLCSFAFALTIPKAIGWLSDKIFLEKSITSFKYVYIFIGIYVCKLIFECCYKWSFAKLGERVLRDIRSDINRILSTIPIKFYDINSSGKIISRGVNDVTNFALIFNPMMYHTIGDVFIIFGSLIIMTIMYPAAGLLMGILAFFLFMALFKFSLLIGRKVRKKRSIISKVNTFVSDSINGMELIYANGYIQEFKRSYNRLIKLYYLSSQKLIKIWGKFPSLHASCLGLMFGFIAFYFGSKLASGDITKGEFITVIFYSSMIFLPFNDIAARQNEFQDGMSSMSKIREILSLDLNYSNNKTSYKQIKSLKDCSIKFENVYFGYKSDHLLFENLNFEIPQGKTTAIIGRTGSGKTSMVSLLTNLYDIQKGRILFGEHNLTNINPNTLYREIGVVTQQLFLFQDTLRENLRLYDNEITDEKIFDLLDSLDLKNKINSFEKGLDTVYDEKDELFSTGEKQLIIIGRMILRDPSILIFDEATANLDNIMESKVQKSLARLLPGRTTIVIAHRLSTIQMADNLVVFSHGEIVESGNPRELLNTGGHYASYVNQ